MSRFRELLAAGELVRVFALGRLIASCDDRHVRPGRRLSRLLARPGTLRSELPGSATRGGLRRANNFDCFVRMAPTDYALVTQNLEAGAGGVMAAQIKSAAHAEQFVTWAKFAPRGLRGLNTSGRDANYTHKSQSNSPRTLIATSSWRSRSKRSGPSRTPTPSRPTTPLTCLFVGPSDLSQAMGVLGQFSHPRLLEGLDRVAAACRRHGKHWGTVAPNPEYTHCCYDKGCRMLSVGADVLAPPTRHRSSADDVQGLVRDVA